MALEFDAKIVEQGDKRREHPIAEKLSAGFHVDGFAILFDFHGMGMAADTILLFVDSNIVVLVEQPASRQPGSTSANDRNAHRLLLDSRRRCANSSRADSVSVAGASLRSK